MKVATLTTACLLITLYCLAVSYPCTSKDHASSEKKV